jgi:hypothetical protein
MKNVLVLYNGQSMFTPTVQDYLESFRRYSRNNIHFLHVDFHTEPAFAFAGYDVVIVTYSCRLCYLENMSPSVRRAVADFRGLKVAFVQDEYQETNKLRAGLLELGVGLVFTCVPESKISWVYPPQMFPGVRFKRVLTGYVPGRLAKLPRQRLPKSENRPNFIGYRGRYLGHCWGDLSFVKTEIGRQFKRACERRGIPHDIAWVEEARIYQDGWFSFITSCRTTLGTPSGCNTFDWDGSLEREYRTLIKAQPEMSYEEYRPRIAHKEEEIDMGQVSPRIFEAAALGTTLVLLEGSYSGVVTPGEDCIIVRKDFSNIESVLDQISDADNVSRLAENAHRNIIASGRWSYERFIAQVDDEIDVATGSDAGARAELDLQSFRLARSYDRSFMEVLSLRSPVQYPLSHWLDLSHLRQQDDGYRRLSEEAVIAFPVHSTSQDLASVQSRSLSSAAHLRFIHDLGTRLVRGARAFVPSPVKRRLRMLLGL